MRLDAPTEAAAARPRAAGPRCGHPARYRDFAASRTRLRGADRRGGGHEVAQTTAVPDDQRAWRAWRRDASSITVRAETPAPPRELVVAACRREPIAVAPVKPPEHRRNPWSSCSCDASGAVGGDAIALTLRARRRHDHRRDAARHS